MSNSNFSNFKNIFVVASMLLGLSSCVQEEPIFEQPNPISKETSDITRDGSPSDLSSIAEAHEYFLHPDGNPNVRQKIYTVGDYRKDGLTGKVTGGLLVRIWNLYSIDKRTNFYLIHVESQTLFKEAYHGVYNCNVSTNGFKTIAKVAEWYGYRVNIKVTPGENSYFYKELHYPNTTVGSASYTTSFGQSYGMCMGMKGKDFNIEGRPSYTFTDSQTYNESDVSVNDYSTMDNNLSWEFCINNEPSASIKPWNTACTKLTDPCATAKSALTTQSDAVIAFPYDPARPPRVIISYQIGLASMCGKAGSTCGHRTQYLPSKDKMETLDIKLPHITPEQAEAAMNKAKK